MDRDEILSVVGPLLKACGGVRLALVFGSMGRGNATDRSDLDVAVLGATNVLDCAASLSAAVGREVDIVNLTEVSIPMLEAIVRDGVVVFECERGVAAIWRSRALASLEIDRPWYERMQKAWLARVAERGVLGQ